LVVVEAAVPTLERVVVLELIEQEQHP